jgi:hypothetical protein
MDPVKGQGGGAGEEGVHVNVILRCRPASAQEIAERAPQVIQCDEALREVTLNQNVGGKSMSRTFRYDKVRARACMTCARDAVRTQYLTASRCCGERARSSRRSTRRA